MIEDHELSLFTSINHYRMNSFDMLWSLHLMYKPSLRQNLLSLTVSILRYWPSTITNDHQRSLNMIHDEPLVFSHSLAAHGKKPPHGTACPSTSSAVNWSWRCNATLLDHQWWLRTMTVVNREEVVKHDAFTIQNINWTRTTSWSVSDNRWSPRVCCEIIRRVVLWIRCSQKPSDSERWWTVRRVIASVVH